MLILSDWVIRSFSLMVGFRAEALLCLPPLPRVKAVRESGRDPIAVVRVVVVRAATAVDIAEVVAVAGIRRAQPPVRGGAIQRITFYFMGFRP